MPHGQRAGTLRRVRRRGRLLGGLDRGQRCALREVGPEPGLSARLDDIVEVRRNAARELPTLHTGTEVRELQAARRQSGDPL